MFENDINGIKENFVNALSAAKDRAAVEAVSVAFLGKAAVSRGFSDK